MDEDSYIRGAGAVRVESRRVGWALAVALVAVLAVAGVVLALVTAAGQSSDSSLRRHGVPVRVTVTSCTGITSGIGMGAEYYQCRGTYTVGGRSAEAVIHGSRAKLDPGDVVAGVVIPQKPSSLAVAGTASSSSANRYTASIVLGSVAVAGAGFLMAWRRGRRRHFANFAPPLGGG